ncbi:protein rep [Staphylococcus aureus]|nr:protein rep [Staphylococcus aureus]
MERKENIVKFSISEILKIKQCGNILEFKPTDEGYLKLHKTWFCKSKLCPVCNWRCYETFWQDDGSK